MNRSDVIELLAFDLGESTRSEDEPWLRVARGELSPDQLVQLRRERSGGDERTLRTQARLYAPPEPEAGQRALDELLARFYAEPEATSGSGTGGGAAGAARPEGGHGDADDPEGRDPSSGVIDLAARRRRRSRIALGTVLAVAAAVVLTWAIVPRDPTGPAGEPMPGFASEWSNQYSGSMRGAPGTSECARYKSDGHLEVRLRPQIALTDDLVIAALARSDDGELRRLAIDPMLSAAGVITIDQRVDELGLTPGRWTVSFFVSRGAHLSERELAELSAPEHPEIAVVRSEVCIER